MIADVHNVVQQVAKWKGVPFDAIMSDNSTHDISYARKLSFYILFVMFDMTHKEIAEFWNMDSSTICRHVNDIHYGKLEEPTTVTDTIHLIKQFRTYDDQQPAY